MRALRRSFLLFAPVSLAVIGVFACEQDSTNQTEFNFPETGTTDTTAQPPIDSNAPLPDAPIDVAKPTTVSVTVTDRNGPKANITIVFHDANGSVLESQTTGADGKATSTGPTAPAMASALVGTQSTKHIVTWTGVEGGDALQLRDLENSPFVGNFAVTFPSVLNGVVSHEVVTTDCNANGGSGVGPIALPIYGNCVRPPQSVLATARDDSNLVIGYAFKKANTPPTDGGDTAVLTNAFTAPTTTTVSVTSPPANGSLDLRLLEISDGFGYDNRVTTGVSDASAPFQTANGFADAIQGNAIFSNGGSILAVAKRQPVASNVALDFAQALPAITNVTRDASNARRPSFTWTTAGSLAATDGGIVRVRFTGPEDANYNWTFVVPPNATTVKAPAFPAAADAWLPDADAGANAYYQNPDIVFIETDLLPGYAPFRATQGVLLGIGSTGGRFGNVNVPTLPQNGNLRATVYVESGG